jgi:predicted Zn-dependent peptidase
VSQDSEKRLIHRRNDAKPRIDLAFHVPPVGHPDLYPLDILEGTLNGKSGRLYKRLVEGDKLAVSVGAGNYWNKYVGEFNVSAVMNSLADPEQVEAVIWEELERLKTEPISERELQKVINQAYANSVRALEDLETIASRLAYYEMYGDWALINEYSSRLAQVKPEDVLKVANKYFKKSRTTTGMLLPRELKNEGASNVK